MNQNTDQVLPRHVAIIMDGNGRWAKARGLERIEGHRVGVNRTEDIITKASELGLGFLTLYAFSKENWKRPEAEVVALMQLLKEFLRSKEEKMLRHKIRFNTLGDIVCLPEDVQDEMARIQASTKHGKGMVLTLALSYGARDEIVRAVNQIIQKKKTGQKEEPITEENFGQFLDTKNMPDPDLIIRTSGEFRISNFLLWQAAYAEFIFEECHWPDFTVDYFDKALQIYAKRERRYGKTSEQLE